MGDRNKVIEKAVLKNAPKEWGKVNISFPELKDLEKKISTFGETKLYLGSCLTMEHEVCFFVSSEPGHFEKEDFINNLFKTFFISPNPNDPEHRLQSTEVKTIQKIYPTDFDFELSWLLENSTFIQIDIKGKEAYLLVRNSVFDSLDGKVIIPFLESANPINSLAIQKIKSNSIPTASNFVVGDLLTLPHMQYRNYAVQTVFLEILYSEAVNLRNRLGFILSSKININGKQEEIFLFIQVKEEKDVQRFQSSMLDIFSEEIKKLSDWNAVRFSETHWEVSSFSIADMAKLTGKKMGILRFDLFVAYASFAAYFFLAPSLIDSIRNEILTEDENINLDSGSVFSKLYSINTALAHKKFRQMSTFAHPLEVNAEKPQWENILVLASFINELDFNDKRILIQNFISQNHSVDSMHEFFFFNDPALANATIKFKKEPRFQEAEFFKYLPENFKKDWRDKKIKIAEDEMNLKNIQVFHDIAAAIKGDKIALSDRGRFLFYSGFYDLVLRDTAEEYKGMMSFAESKKILEGFPKKFVNDFIAGFNNKELLYSFLFEKECVPFFQEYVSKNRKQELADDFRFFERGFIKKQIDFSDLLTPKKAVVEKIKTLQAEFV